MKIVTMVLEVDEHGAEPGRELSDEEVQDWARYRFEGGVGAFHGLDDATPRAGKLVSVEVANVT